MSLRDLMLADLESGLAIVRDGHELIPAWRILTPDGDFLILTRFDPDHPDQRERMLALVPRFMAWKLAIAFVLTAETWLGPATHPLGRRSRADHWRVAPTTLGRDAAHPPHTSSRLRAGRVARRRRHRRALFSAPARRANRRHGRGSRHAGGRLRRRRRAAGAAVELRPRPQTDQGAVMAAPCRQDAGRCAAAARQSLPPRPPSGNLRNIRGPRSRSGHRRTRTERLRARTSRRSRCRRQRPPRSKDAPRSHRNLRIASIHQGVAANAAAIGLEGALMAHLPSPWRSLFGRPPATTFRRR